MSWANAISQANSYAGKVRGYAGQARRAVATARGLGSALGDLAADPARAVARALAGPWTILSQSGAVAVEFGSMLDVEIKAEGKAVSTPIEKGSFATYNKVQSPKEINVTLGLDGNTYAIDAALQALADLQQGAELVNVSTPTGFYEGYTIESSTVSVIASALLEVSLRLVEVREVETRQTTGGGGGFTPAKCKNATSASTVNRGKVATKDASQVKDAPKPKSVLMGGGGIVGMAMGRK